MEQEFNSLDAQREACEAFIASQKHEGWTCLPEPYDDGGYTGGNIDRPALKRLLSDVEAGKIDCIVVYKVDRLSRSLLDFARMMETLEKHHVSFVSVTQQFNTSTSMGRLILNVLLSFAQFEREMISERTRDKIAATRRKGKWTGGLPILGYDVDPRGRRLIVNEVEAARVREIFELYLEKQSLLATVKELNDRGWITKRWITKNGRECGGKPFTKNNLFRLLTNAIYIGKIRHKSEIYDGEQSAIVDKEIWQTAHDLLQRNGTSGGKMVRNKHGALLKGLLRCVPCNAAMVHAYTVRRNKQYRYYVCLHAQQQGWDSCPTKSVPAQEIERFIIDQVRRIGCDPNLVAETLQQTGAQSKERIEQLNIERRALQRELEHSDREMRILVNTTPQDSTHATDRLADLQERIHVTEQRATCVREEVIALSREMVSEKEVASALSLFDPVWESLSPREQARAIQLLIEQVAYDGKKGTVSVTFRPAGIKTLAGELETCGQEKSR